MIVLPHLPIVTLYDTLVVLVDSVDFAINVTDLLVVCGLICTIYAVNFLIVSPDSVALLLLLLTDPGTKL